MWCWAASAEMIMGCAGQDVPQCQQANHAFNRTDCCLTPTPDACVLGGWPDFPAWNFACQVSPWGVALTFAQLSAQIDANAPVEFSWGWQGGGGHAMVARGYSSTGPQQLVYINDPWVPNVGNTRWIAYADYVAKANDHVHWLDYYNIKFSGAGGPGGQTTTQQQPMNTDINNPAPGGFADPESAAREALKLYPTLVTPETAVEMGFEKVPADASGLQLGCPLPIFYIRHDALAAHLTGQDVRKLLTDGEERLYPVHHDGKLVSAIIVAKQAGVWSLRSLGDSNLVKQLAEVRDRQATIAGKLPSNYFIVHVPSLYHMFVGHYDDAGRLLLTHVHDHAELRFVKHATQTGEQVIQAMLPKAKLGLHALPVPGQG
jgi:hypothetical protein